MKQQPYFTIIIALCIIPVVCGFSLEASHRKNIGVFTPQDQRLEGILYGNWGSRPYEYYWVASITPLKGKQVIDLGVGLPSQYNWYEYVIKNLNPAWYVGVDFDERIKKEVKTGSNFEIKHMNMALLRYPNKMFDVALCISTFEHIPYHDFIQSIAEAHRVLKDDGILIITLDEEWDKTQPSGYENGWNTLEKSLIEQGIFKRKQRSFGLPEFLWLIKDYFVLVNDDAIVDSERDIIYSAQSGVVYYDRADRDPAILNSGLPVNSCVSYAVLKKK